MSLRQHAPPDDHAFDHDAALRGCAKGNLSALRDLYDHEAAALVGIAMRILRRRDLANDVVHDAFMLIWQRAATFDPARGSGRTWIISVVRHRCFDVLRRTSRESALDPVTLNTIPDDAADAFTQLGNIQDAQGLYHCLEKLDALKRDAILLAYIDGLTQKQIADRQNVPIGTVKSWIHRGIISLRECLA